MNFTSTFILFFPYLLTVITTLILYLRYPKLITYWNNNSSPYLNAGIILLIAMIGSIVLTLRKKPDVKRQNVIEQIYRSPNNSIEVIDVKPGEGL